MTLSSVSFIFFTSFIMSTESAGVTCTWCAERVPRFGERVIDTPQTLQGSHGWRIDSAGVSEIACIARDPRVVPEPTCRHRFRPPRR